MQKLVCTSSNKAVLMMQACVMAKWYILPARAATEGIAGASKASANTRLYVKPKVVFPKRDTMPYAMRLPRPDLMKPPESQKAIAISHLNRHPYACCCNLYALRLQQQQQHVRDLACKSAESC